ncbi:MAG: Stress response protein nst1 [Pycnora praestabilis]|nr:MAG: Stress response protein nst1 [Pycnora praestabilis]
MPMNQQQSSLEPRVSPELTPTATYSKKDGSKIITVPKSPGESSTVPEDHFSREQLFAIQNSMATGEKAQGAISGQNVVDHGLAVTASSGSNEATAAGVNRKKQKRRQKQAARLAAEQHMSTEYVSDGSMYTGHAPNSQSNHQHHVGDLHHKSDYIDQDFDDPEQFEPAEGEDLYYTDDEGRIYQDPYQSGHHSTNGYAANDFMPNGHANKKSKKKKKNNLGSFSNHDLHSNPLGASSTSLSTPPASLAPPPPPPPPPLSTTASRNIQPTSRDRIWNTSTQEERERIKDFWLSLGEEERRSLVKVEKEAVLRKMKEQQKHSCSCTVCGRKRTAIEEELEVLYDAYYEELEQYANHQQARLEDGTPMMPPPRRFNHPMARPPPNKIPPLMSTRQPPRGRIEEVNDDVEEGDDEEYSEEDDDEEELSDEEPEDEPRGPAADFFNFGNSLTVQGGILTVADDLLKNDGKKFIEMMEQLAERRMQREEEAQYAASGLGHPAMGMQQRSHAGHNHGPHPEEEEYDEEEDDDDYGSEEEDDYDDDDDDEMVGKANG